MERGKNHIRIYTKRISLSIYFLILKYILRAIRSALRLVKKFPAFFAELVSRSILRLQSIPRRCLLECPSFFALDFAGRMDPILILLSGYSIQVRFILRVVMMPPAELASSPQDQPPIEGWKLSRGSAEMKSFPRQGQ